MRENHVYTQNNATLVYTWFSGLHHVSWHNKQMWLYMPRIHTEHFSALVKTFVESCLWRETLAVVASGPPIPFWQFLIQEVNSTHAHMNASSHIW